MQFAWTIPTVGDRIAQMVAKMYFEPLVEPHFHPDSYGYRPGKSALDAVGTARERCWHQDWVIDLDIKSFFDRINHEALLKKLQTFSALRRAVRAWLKAGVMDEGTLFPTSEGAPQGGVISPLLANVALHGLTTAIEDAFPRFKRLPPDGRLTRWKPGVIRYADDFVVFHRDREAIEHVKEIVTEWLKGMGLEMKPSKTRVTHTLEAVDGLVGFDFLGFHFRQYTRGVNRCARSTHGEPVGFTTTIRPSAESQKRFLRKIRDKVRSNAAIPQVAMVRMLNPVIRGWGNYFSTVVSQEVFDKMDMLICRKLWAWARRRHSNKGRHWVARKYWLLGQHGWTFGPTEKTTLLRMSNIPIRRHTKVQGHRSPFDGDAVYWSTRTGTHSEMPERIARLLKAQTGRSACCGLYFKLGDSVGTVYRDQSQSNMPGRVGLVHQHCHDTTRPVVCDDNTPFC